MTSIRPPSYYKWSQMLTTQKQFEAFWSFLAWLEEIMEELTEEEANTERAFLQAMERLMGDQLNFSEKDMKQGREDPPIVNWMDIEWRFPGIKLPWPFGSLEIPTAILGKARLGDADFGMDEENSRFPERLLGIHWKPPGEIQV